MPHLYNQQDIGILTEELKVFLHADKGPIDKLDYFSTLIPEFETARMMELSYRNENIDLIPEVENAVIKQLELAEKKELGIQLHLSPASFIVHTDRLFLQQILFRLMVSLLDACEKKSVVSVYVTDSDGKCIIEAISHAETANKKNEDDYFKKYRITNPLHASMVQDDAVLAVYKKLVEDMGGELAFAFTNEKQRFFRLKFPIA